MVAALLTLGMIGGFLAVLAAPATTAGAATTESFSLSTAANPGQSTVTWQNSSNKLPDPTTLNGQIDPTSGAISNASLTFQPIVNPPQQGENTQFLFSDQGNATGTYDSTTGAVTLKDSLTMTFTGTGAAPITCVSTPVIVALSGTYDSTAQNVTLATTSSFTIPQFPSNSGQNCELASASLNQDPGGVAGSTGNAMSLVLHGSFAPGVPTTTALSVSPSSPQLAGTAVTLTAKVTPTSGTGTPTGTVTFESDGASLGSGALSSGTATLTSATLPHITDQQLTAVYNGDPNFSASTSSAVPYTVQPKPTINSTFPSQVTAGLNNFPTPTPFTVTVSNPAGGGTYPNLFLYLGFGGGGGILSSQIQFSYQDQAGAWCPLSTSASPPKDTNFQAGTTGSYFGGPGSSSCGSSPAFSLNPGGSLTVHLEVAFNQAPYSSQPYYGPLSLAAALESGTCASFTSCTAVAPLEGATAPTTQASSTLVNESAPGAVPVQITNKGIPGPGETVRSGYSMFLHAGLAPTSAAQNEYYLTQNPTGTVQFYIDSNLVYTATVAPTTSSNSATTGEYLLDPGVLAPGTHTLTINYAGDQTYAPASLTDTFTVIAGPPPGTPYTCSITGPFGGLVWGTNNFQAFVRGTGAGIPTAALPGTKVTASNVSVTLDVSGVGGFGRKNPIFNNNQNSQSIGFSPGGGTVNPGAATFAFNQQATDLIATWSGLSTTATVTGKPGDVLSVGVGSISFSYSLGGAVSCKPVAEPAAIGSVSIIGTTLSVSPDSSAATGSPVTMTASVAPLPPPPNVATGKNPVSPGQVDFFDGSTYLGTATVSTGGSGQPPAGDAVLSVTSLAVGTHKLSAAWSGYGFIPSSTSNVVDYFVGNPTTTTLASDSPSPSNAADPVTFTATVSPPKGATTMPTGSVNFTEDGTPIKSCTGVALGSDTPPTATCQVTLGAGETHKIVASYNGDTMYVGSTSDAVTQATLPGVHVMLASSKNPAIAGPVAEQVALWAVVAPDSGSTTPTGTLDFLARGNPRCSNVPLIADGSMAWAVCVTKFTSPDITANLTAMYSGDSTYSGATSQTLHQRTLPATTTKLSSVARSGGRVSLTAEVRPSSGSGATPQGVVAFVVDKQVYMPCLFVPLGGAGRGTCSLTLSAGTHYAHAVYLGSGGYSSSESNVVTEKIGNLAKHRR